MGEGMGEYSSWLLASSVLVGEGCAQPKKLLSFEEPRGDLTGERGGDLGNGLLRVDSVLEFLSGGRPILVGACGMSESGRTRSSCGGIGL